MVWEGGNREVPPYPDSATSQTCPQHTFLLEYRHHGRMPEITQHILEMTLNGSGIRDIARVLHISPTTVIEELKKRASAPTH